MANIPTVRHVSDCYIRPKSDVEAAINPLYLSPMELACLKIHYNQKGLLFTKPMDNDHPMSDLLDNLKHSLSVTLLHFYPLAGQLEARVDEDQHTSLVFINCNKGPGARFIHATSNMAISDISSPKYVPDVVQSSFFDLDRVPSLEGLKRPLLSVQVTELVDGVFIGCSMNHACADGNSFWHFFNMWSEVFMSNGDGLIQISRPPIHDRWLVDKTDPIIKLPLTNPDESIRETEAPKLNARIFHFSAESIAKLKSKACSECGVNDKISSFQVLAALLWRSITRARGMGVPNETETKCKFSIDYRRRVEPALSQNCFGNLIQSSLASCEAGELLEQKVGSVALLLNRAVAEHSNSKVRKVMEEWIQSPVVNDPGFFFDPYCILIGSSPRFGMYGTEFGMGKAVAVLSGYANKLDGKVTCYPGREGGGSVDVEICLPTGNNVCT